MCEMSMARTSADYIGPFSTNSLISMMDANDGTAVANKIKQFYYVFLNSVTI
jgi:hypothetical protein